METVQRLVEAAEALPPPETVQRLVEATEALPPMETMQRAAEAAEALPPMETVQRLAEAAEALPPVETVRAAASMSEAASRAMSEFVGPGSPMSAVALRAMSEFVGPGSPMSAVALRATDSAVRLGTSALADLPERILNLPAQPPVLPLPSLVPDSPWASIDPMAEPSVPPFAEPSERAERIKISDDVLRQRCLDLLNAQGDFDRPVNQALIVLEDRVRTMARLPATAVGKSLMRGAFGNDGPIILSDIRSEQEGWRSQFVGMYAMLRNPTSHGIVETYDRDDAVAVVFYVDFLLRRLARGIAR